MNTKRTSGPIVTGVLPGKDAHEERRKREAQALEIIKAIRRSPSTRGEPTDKIVESPKVVPLRPTHLAGEDPEAPGMIYFVYSCGRIKIGYTAELAARMSQFGTHSPMPPVLLLTIGACERDEAVYHQMFATDRVHREWFRLSYDLREFLDSQFDPDARLLLFEAEYDFCEMTQQGGAFISKVFRSIKREMQNANRGH